MKFFYYCILVLSRKYLNLNIILQFHKVKGGKEDIMKKELVGIFIMMLLIITSVPVVGTVSEERIDETITNVGMASLEELTDQYQENCGDCRFFENYAWQQFKPSKSRLLRVEVCIAQWFTGSPDLMLTIEKPLGTILTGKSLSVMEIPDSYCDWVSFDIPDINLETGELYYIVLQYPMGGEYSWCCANGNPYPAGVSSIGSDWDWCFRTIAEKTRSRTYDNLEDFPILTLFLQKLLKFFPIFELIL